jgi:hypothetical protein
MLALLSLAFADPCGMVPPAWIPDNGGTAIERLGDQETYVFFADGMQTIAIRPGFTGSVDEFGMLIPMPAPPALRKIGDATFQHLAAAVDAPAVQVHFYDPRARKEKRAYRSAPAMSVEAPEDDGLAFDEVRVVNQEAMGMYEVAVLEAGSPLALQRWMTERDFRYPDGMDDVVLDYVEGGWLFVAVKTRVGQMKGVEPRPGMREVQPKLPAGATFTGSVQGMAFRFHIDEPIVPMRLSTFNGDSAVNRVYMLSDRPVRVVDRPEDLVQRQVAGDALHRNVAEPLPVTYHGGDAADVTGDDQRALAVLRDPSPHNGVARDLMAADLLALQTGDLTLPFEVVEKELLNVNEALGLRGAEVDKLLEDAIQARRDEALGRVTGDLREYTLTVIDGDFGQSWLRANNLRFAGWSMPPDRNDAAHWRRSPVQVGALSVAMDRSSWWPF